jgi:hypothetical protein
MIKMIAIDRDGNGHNCPRRRTDKGLQGFVCGVCSRGAFICTDFTCPACGCKIVRCDVARAMGPTLDITTLLQS